MSVAPSSLSLPSLSPNPKPPSLFGISRQRLFHSCNFLLQVRCARRSQRTGKLRYPSEKKRLRDMKRPKIDVNDKLEGVWRLSKLGVEVHRDPGKDFLGISDALLEQIAKVLEFPVASMLPAEAFTVVRKSFDARKVLKEPKFVYTVDMDAKKLFDLEPRVWDFISQLEPKAGLVELMPQVDASGGLMNIITDCKQKEEAVEINGEPIHSNGSNVRLPTEKPKVAVVGSGPAGLFATLVLAEFGADVTLIERGQPVEQRGRDIGALVVRRLIQLDSNFCFGEVPGVMGNS